MISKKIFLAFVVTGVLAILAPRAAAQSNSDAAAEAGQQMTGTWIFDLGGSFRALHTFTVDGGLVVISNQSPSTGTVAFGEWVRTGDREFDETFVRFIFDAQGNFAGTAKVREHLKLNETLDRLTSVAKLEIFDPAGNLVRSNPPGTDTATRIKVEPVQ